MARLVIISKYCVVRLPMAAPLSKLYSMLTPSIGFCVMPSTASGAGSLQASRIVGTTSIT